MEYDKIISKEIDDGSGATPCILPFPISSRALVANISSEIDFF